MCPLRLILIFLSATLAGFFLLKTLKSQQPEIAGDLPADPTSDSSTKTASPTRPSNAKWQVRETLVMGFWTCVDMASGSYLWKNLVSARSSSSSSSASSLKRTT